MKKEVTTRVVEWFSGTHKQLMEVLGISTNNTEESKLLQTIVANCN